MKTENFTSHFDRLVISETRLFGRAIAYVWQTNHCHIRINIAIKLRLFSRVLSANNNVMCCFDSEISYLSVQISSHVQQIGHTLHYT